MARRSRRRGTRRFGRRRRGVSKKPALAVLAGVAAGPAAIAFGYGDYSTPIWQVESSKMGMEAIDRTMIAYTGFKPSDGSHFGLERGGYIGTVALAAGILAHYAAGKFGVNRALANSKMPFRI